MAQEIAPETAESSSSFSKTPPTNIEQTSKGEQLAMAKKTKERNRARYLAARNATNTREVEEGVKAVDGVEGVENGLKALSINQPMGDLPPERAINDRRIQETAQSNIETRTGRVAANGNSITAVPTLKPLAFRSYKNGTLITNNFLPTDRPKQVTQPYPHAKQPTMRAEATISDPQFQVSEPSIFPAGTTPFIAQSQAAGPSFSYVDSTTRVGASPTSEISYCSYPSSFVSTFAAACPLLIKSAQNNHWSWNEQDPLRKLKSLIKTIPQEPITSHRVSRNQASQSIDGSYHPFYELEPPPKIPRTWVERAEPFNRDILITIDSISHNIRHMKAEYDENGNEVWRVMNDYNPERYDVIEALKKMTEDQKEVFWMQNWIGITLDFGNPADTVTETEEEALHPLYPITRLNNSVLETLRKFGDETGMHDYALTVFITIICPLRKDPNVNYKNLTKAQQRSPEFREVVDLAKEMNKFTKIKKMEVILMNVPGVRARLTMEQLNYALPFYDCNFEDWTLMWQNEYMAHSEAVQNWPITYLDREMHKVHQERARFVERMTGGGDNQDGASSSAGGGSVRYDVEYSAAHQLQNTRWIKNDARGYTYEHRLEAEEAPKRPLEYYRHP